MKKFSICTVLGLFLTIALVPQAVMAISRSCDGRMYILVKGYDGFAAQEKTLENFSAAASCSAASPNTCRRRARDKAHRCMQMAWDIRWQRREPEACQLAAGIHHYTMPNLKCEIFEEICEVKSDQGRPAFHEEVAIVYRRSTGQTSSCSRQVEISEYSIDNCTINERNEHCGT